MEKLKFAPREPNLNLAAQIRSKTPQFREHQVVSKKQNVFILSLKVTSFVTRDSHIYFVLKANGRTQYMRATPDHSIADFNVWKRYSELRTFH